MSSEYTHKLVNGETIPLTPEEIAEFEAMAAAIAADPNSPSNVAKAAGKTANSPLPSSRSRQR